MNTKKKPEYSKLLASFITMLFFVQVIFSNAVWLLQGVFPQEILETVAYPFSIVVSGYFVKAGVENIQKIKNSNIENTYIDDDPNVG